MKTYILEVTSDGGHSHMASKNDGFTAFELIGILERKKMDIVAQMDGEVEPTIITREVVK